MNFGLIKKGLNKKRIYKSKLASKHKCLVLSTHISFLEQWHNNLLYIVEVIDDFYMNLALTKLN